MRVFSVSRHHERTASVSLAGCVVIHGIKPERLYNYDSFQESYAGSLRRAYALLWMTVLVFFCLPSYAQGVVSNNPLDIDDEAFRSRSIDMPEHSAFDVLQEQNRYKNEPDNVFDVAEAEDNQEESNIPTIPHTKEIATVPEENIGSYRKLAKIVALNKITARSKQLSIPVGGSSYFGNIEIFVEKCWNSEDIYSPSSKILVKAIENKIDEDSKNIFHGWLISSNIPVSGLQDPSYELIAVECYDNKPKTE